MDALTFGIELEMICVYEEKAFTDTSWPDLVPDETLEEEEPFVGATTAVRYFLQKYKLMDDASAETFSSWWVHCDSNSLTNA